MRKIVLCNQKGGVAKSTTAVNLGAGLARKGQRVLIVDMDPQANATFSLLGYAEPDNTVYDVLARRASLAEVIKPALNMPVDIVPASIELSGAEVELASVIGAQLRLRNSLARSELAYDFVLIDSPPNLGLLTVNALAAADEVLIPIAGGAYGVRGLAQLMDTIEQVRDDLDAPNIKIVGVLVTMTDHTNVAREVESGLREQLGELVFEAVIPRNIAVEEAHTRQQSVLDYAPTSKGALGYAALVDEVLNRDD